MANSFINQSQLFQNKPEQKDFDSKKRWFQKIVLFKRKIALFQILLYFYKLIQMRLLCENIYLP